MTGAELRRQVAPRLPAALELLADLVNRDSPFDDPAGVRDVLEQVAGRAESLGASTEWRVANDFPHLRASLPGGARRVALVGHADTVFPRGTVEDWPFRTEGAQAYGPGVADMKGGLVVALLALEQLLALPEPRPSIEFVVVGDEEVRLTPPPFMDVLGDCDACFVLEAAGTDGQFVIARKAGAWARLRANGRSAHSGTEPERGSSAILPLCHELLRVAELDGSRDGLTVSIGSVAGGSLTNVVPAFAEASLDIRSYDPAVLDAALDDVRDVGSHPGVQVTLELDGRWPGMLASPATEHLAETYGRMAREAGIRAEPERRGGTSDGCWVADAGVPTLDGLGPVGGSDHSPEEYIETESLVDRTALLVGLLMSIERDGLGPRAAGG